MTMTIGRILDMSVVMTIGMTMDMKFGYDYDID